MFFLITIFLIASVKINIMRKSFLVIIFCIMSVVIFQAFTIHKEPHFKNLQILPKDISDHDLDSFMHHFSASLGVRCNFCHVRNEAAKQMDFASDEKPEKNIARKMMLMSIDINKSYFQGMEMDHHDMDHDMKGMDHDMKMDSTMNKNMDHDMKGMNHKAMDTLMNSGDVKYMLQSVTCFTCHRGDAHPETKAPEQPGGPRPPGPPPPMNDAPSAGK